MVEVRDRTTHSAAACLFGARGWRPSHGVAALLLLLAFCLPLLSARPAAADEDEHEAGYDYIGARKCKTCHRKKAIGDQYGIWAKTRHAEAFESLASEQAAEWAAAAGVEDPKTDERCLRCHVTAYGVPESRLARTFDPKLGVQCEACHGAGSGYRKKKTMMDEKLAMSKGLIPSPKEDACRECHNDESPGWKPDRYTLADGTKVGFDFEQAKRAIEHPVPEDYDPLAHGEAD